MSRLVTPRVESSRGRASEDAVEVVQNAEWETGKSFLRRLEPAPELEVVLVAAGAADVLEALVLEALVLEAATLVWVVLATFVLAFVVETSAELDTLVETAWIALVTAAVVGTDEADDWRAVVAIWETEMRECGLHVRLLWRGTAETEAEPMARKVRSVVKAYMLEGGWWRLSSGVWG